MKVMTLLGSLILIGISCEKNHQNEIAFPAETQTGKNTFGCYIDGVAFIPLTTLNGNVHPLNVYYNYDSTVYYKAGFLSIQGIDARYSLDNAGEILMQKLDVFSAGEYALTNVSSCIQPYNCDAGAYTNAKLNKTYFTQSGKLTITKLDTLNKIISGRFFFTSKDTSGNIKEVTNGVFDVKYIN